MRSVTPTAAPVKGGRRRPAKAWYLNVSAVVNNGVAVRLTSVEPRKSGPAKVEHFHYWLEAIPSAFGLGFHWVKWPQDVRPGEPSEYHSMIDPPHGHPSCECAGFLRWSHRTGPCKHVKALLKLHELGKLPAARCACGAPAVAGPRCLACHDAAADAAARRADLADLDTL
jgi:hypothetical protein